MIAKNHPLPNIRREDRVHTIIMSDDGRKVRGVVLQAGTISKDEVTLCRDCGENIMNSKGFISECCASVYDHICDKCGRRITSANQRIDKKLKSKLKKLKKKNAKLREEIELLDQIEELFMIGDEGDMSEPSFTIDDEWARKAIMLITKMHIE